MHYGYGRNRVKEQKKGKDSLQQKESLTWQLESSANLKSLQHTVMIVASSHINQINMQLLSLHLFLFLYFTLYSMYFFLYFCTRFDNEIQYKTTLIVRRTGLSTIFTWSVCFLPQDFHFPLVTVQNFGQKPKRTLSLFNLSSFPAFRVSLDFVWFRN